MQCISGAPKKKPRGKSPGLGSVVLRFVGVPVSVVGGCWVLWPGRLVRSGVVFRPVFPLLVPFLFHCRRADPRTYVSARHLLTPVVQECDMLWPWYPIVARTSFFYLFVRSLLFSMMLKLLVTGCVSPSTLVVVTGTLTMINRTWVANLSILQGRWRLARACCFVDQLAWIARGRPLSQTLSCFRITMRKRLCFETYGFPCCRVPSRTKCWCSLIS